MKIEVIDYGYDKLPVRAYYNDAGADIHVCCESRLIYPNETMRIPLGFGLKIPDGMVGFIFPRSGLSVKGIICELPPIDSGYRGEIHAIVTNHSNETFVIHKGDRIGQLVILPVIIADFVPKVDENRENSAFGSTGI